MALAKNPPVAQENATAITLRVYDYHHANRPLLLAAEGEATRILADAGVDAHWVDCPTSRDAWDNYPQCRSAWKVNDYSLRIMPEAMVGLLGTWQDALGFAPDCDGGPYCWAGVFYDRVRSLAGGATAAESVLLGRVMAHEIGHLLLGVNSHSRTGIMRANWSERELSLNATTELYFTPEQSRRMKAQIAEQMQPKVADLRR
jgi:hypothetical protein